MKNAVLKLSIVLAALTVTIISCKKSSDPAPVTASTSSDVDSPVTQATSANDQSNTSSATDLALNDVNGLINSGGTSARLETDTVDYTIVSNTTSSTLTGTAKHLEISYKGIYHYGRIRTGSVSVTLTSGSHFKDVNAVWTVSFTGYSVRLLSDSDSNVVILNGVHTVTNLTGGLVRDVFINGLASVVHQTVGTSTLTFGKSGATRDWQVARKLSYTNTSGVIGFEIEGTGSADGYTSLTEWGTNRFGDKFYTSVTTPIKSSSVCGLHKPIAGVRVHTLLATDGSTKTSSTETITTGSNCENIYTITFTNRKGETITRAFLIK